MMKVFNKNRFVTYCTALFLLLSGLLFPINGVAQVLYPNEDNVITIHVPGMESSKLIVTAKGGTLVHKKGTDQWIARPTGEKDANGVMQDFVITVSANINGKREQLTSKAYEVIPVYAIINGVKWATRNVDAPGTFAANPEDPGMLYQWNRNIGWSAIPSDTTWETANDVCPSGWRVPTVAELGSLAASGSQWTTQNGVNGRIFGSGDNTIFLPAAGYRNPTNGALASVGTIGYYWSSTVSGTNAFRLSFGSSFVDPGNLDDRAFGFSVRCVSE